MCIRDSSKQMVLASADRTLREHVLAQDYAALANLANAPHDLAEAAAAFREKREPRFRGLSPSTDES